MEICPRCLVMHMLKQLQCIHSISVFQVQLLQGRVPLSFVPTNVIASIREVLEPLVQIQEANVQYPSLNEGTYQPEYYMTIHLHT